MSLEAETSSSSLTTAQKARMERNRLKAVTLREAKLIPHPTAKICTDSVEQSVVKVQGTKYIDSGGGFLIEEEVLPSAKNTFNEGKSNNTKPVPVLMPFEKHMCELCEKPFDSSYLLETFDHCVCDGCRDNEDKHSLITKTEAKQEYLLKDCDFDKREPPLKFIIRKNPHNPRWGEMKLYLHHQVEKRALEVWGSEETLQKELEIRNEQREKSKVKRYNKELRALRMNVRSSLYDKTKAVHEHSFGDESYNEEEDNYTHTCKICGHAETYEKM